MRPVNARRSGHVRQDPLAAMRRGPIRSFVALVPRGKTTPPHRGHSPPRTLPGAGRLRPFGATLRSGERSRLLFFGAAEFD